MTLTLPATACSGVTAGAGIATCGDSFPGSTLGGHSLRQQHIPARGLQSRTLTLPATACSSIRAGAERRHRHRRRRLPGLHAERPLPALPAHPGHQDDRGAGRAGRPGRVLPGAPWCAGHRRQCVTHSNMSWQQGTVMLRTLGSQDKLSLRTTSGAEHGSQCARQGSQSGHQHGQMGSGKLYGRHGCSLVRPGALGTAGVRVCPRSCTKLRASP